jgi:KaiC/GvpD/RAD55 family RecA-like ATPase
MSTPYSISGILPDGKLDELAPGTSVMISGPAMVGKRELAIRLLAAGHKEGDGILCVTTSNNSGRVLDDLENEIPTLDRSRVGIVDCSGRDHQQTIQEIATEQVSSPGDLTGISIGTAKLLQRFANQDISEVRHGLVSVSTLLQYLDLDTVFKFLHIYTSRISDTQGLGVFTVDNASHDPQTINTITSEFDCVFELRETDTGDREIRLRGHSDSSRTWQQY